MGALTRRGGRVATMVSTRWCSSTSSSAFLFSSCRPHCAGSSSARRAWSSRANAVPAICIEQRRGISSDKAEKSDNTISYVQGISQDIGNGKWEPHEFANQHKLFEKIKLLGEKTEQDVLTEIAKYLFASLPLLIEKLKMEEVMFHDLKVEDLMVDKYGQFVVREGALLENVTQKVISRSYDNAPDIMKRLIHKSCGANVEIPKDVAHLFSKMQKKKTPHGYPMVVHPSLLPLATRSQAMLDLFDFARTLPTKQRRNILRTIQLSANQWPNVVKHNILFAKFFSYMPNRFQAKDPDDLFTCLRHVECHMLDYQDLLGKYNKNQVRILAQCKFLNVMTAVHWKLWGEKLLVYIESEDYFCLPGVACCRPGFCFRKRLRLSIPSPK